MNKWTWFILLLVAFNILLLFSYFKKKEVVKETFAAIQNEPPIEEFLEISDKAMYSIEYLTSYPYFFNTVSPSRNLGDRIKVIYQSEYKGSAPLFFSQKTNIPAASQDSLWLVYQNYRTAVDEFVVYQLEERNAYRARYLKVMSILIESRTTRSKPRRKRLQYSLDSVCRLPNHTYQIDLKDIQRINQFATYMEVRANPARELRIRNLMSKMDDLLPVKGKMMHYGKIYSLDNLTTQERKLLFRFMIKTKSEVDKLISFIAYK